MKFIIGKKIGMSRMYDKEGKAIPVSLIKAEDCYVTRIKDEKKDGYKAIQIAFLETKKKDGRRGGCLKKAGVKVNLKRFVEFRVDDLTKYKLGDIINISDFKAGDTIDVSGLSKGRGFAGVMKRHGFHGSPHSHGHKHDWRAPGAIGSGFPEHVFKGVRMAGRFGVEKTTIKNLKVVEVDKEDKILAIKGAIPGATESLVKIIANS